MFKKAWFTVKTVVGLPSWEWILVRSMRVLTIILIFGGICLVMAGLAVVNFNKFLLLLNDNEHIENTLSVLLWSVGTFTTICSLTGFNLLYGRNFMVLGEQISMVSFIIFSGVVSMLHVGSVVIVRDNISFTEMWLQKGFLEAMRKSEQEVTVKLLFDEIQQKYQCCGDTGVEDWIQLHKTTVKPDVRIQLHKTTVNPDQLHETRVKVGRLHETTVKPDVRIQLHKTTVKPDHLHKTRVKVDRLHETTVKPDVRIQLQKTTVKPDQLHKTRVKVDQLHETTVKPEVRIQLHKTTVKPDQLHETTVKLDQLHEKTVKPNKLHKTTVKPNSVRIIIKQNAKQEAQSITRTKREGRRQSYHTKKSDGVDTVPESCCRPYVKEPCNKHPDLKNPDDTWPLNNRGCTEAISSELHTKQLLPVLYLLVFLCSLQTVLTILSILLEILTPCLAKKENILKSDERALNVVDEQKAQSTLNTVSTRRAKVNSTSRHLLPHEKTLHNERSFNASSFPEKSRHGHHRSSEHVLTSKSKHINHTHVKQDVQPSQRPSHSKGCPHTDSHSTDHTSKNDLMKVYAPWEDPWMKYDVDHGGKLVSVNGRRKQSPRKQDMEISIATPEVLELHPPSSLMDDISIDGLSLSDEDTHTRILYNPPRPSILQHNYYHHNLNKSSRAKYFALLSFPADPNSRNPGDYSPLNIPMKGGFIKLTLNDQHFNTLIDTGAAASFMNPKLVYGLQQVSYPLTVCETHDTVIIPDNRSYYIHQIATMEISISGRPFVESFYILPIMATDIILGYTFLAHEAATIIFETNVKHKGSKRKGDTKHSA